MACLSATTVALSLAEGCPGLAFYILEVVVNSAMILEVGIRLIAFGKVRQLRFYSCPENKAHVMPPRLAILEVTVQHTRLDFDIVLCHDLVGARICGLWVNVKRRGTSGHPASCGKKRSSIRPPGSRHAQVSYSVFAFDSHAKVSLPCASGLDSRSLQGRNQST